MPSQTITWTALPAGAAPGAVRLSVLIAPRLRTDGASQPLSAFPDWSDWPRIVSGMSFAVGFPDLGITGAPVEAVRVSTPDSARWRALFTPKTTVRGHVAAGATRRRIRSYPTAHLLGFVAGRWGRFGALSPDEHPSRAELVGSGAFGPLGFEADAGGAKRRGLLAGRLEEHFDTGANSTPADWAIPYDAGDTGADGIARSFLQLTRFHRRRPSGSGTLPPLPEPEFDFHQAVATTRQYPALQRMLGLVVDLHLTDPRVLALLHGPVRNGWVTVTPKWNPALGTPVDVDVTPHTACLIGGNRFEARPRDPNTADWDRGLLCLGRSGSFLTIPVDIDGAALLARQFADNVARARDVADGHPLPALRTAGFAVARTGRASGLARGLARGEELNDTAFTKTGDKRAGTLQLYLDDLVQGYRWDVRDTADTAWRTLMGRTGHYRFLSDGPGTAVAVTEEGVVTTAPTGSGAPGDTDLYLQEQLVQWTGWSLGNVRPGAVVGPDGSPHRVKPAVREDFPFVGDFGVPPGSLPRLRFGHSYRLRARVVDLAGNSRPPATGELEDRDELRTATVVHRRFEPVNPPEVLLRQPRTQAEGLERLVIRSTTGSDTTGQESVRHLVPPRTSQLMAEQHGCFDATGAGRPLRDVYDMITTRDAATLEQLAAARAEPAPYEESFYYDTDSLPVPYLPDPLARRILVSGLPDAAGNSSTLPVEASSGDWPTHRAWRIRLTRGGTAGWTRDEKNRLLEVRLAPGDVYTLRVSSRFDDGDVDLMGVWEWIREWAARSAPGTDLAALRSLIAGGRHTMFTPHRELTLVHAVRTPLKAPTVTALSADRAGGASSTWARLHGAVDISRKSTGTVDLVGEWSMPVDEGPGGPAPEPARIFRAPVATLRVERAHGASPGPDALPFDVRHEFGDTRHRRVVYRAVATSPFTEYFRAETELALTGGKASYTVDAEPAGIKIRDRATGDLLQPAPASATDPQTADGDYLLDPGGRTVLRTAGGSMPENGTLVMSYVPPTTTRTSAALGARIVHSTARPAAPRIHSIVPTFSWNRTGQQTVRKGGLRVYLERPWWSSGPGERLGIVLWKGDTADPSPRLEPYVTMWGRDPAFATGELPATPTNTSFPGAPLTGFDLPLAEAGGAQVDAVGYDVAYDAGRGLWYADIEVTLPRGERHTSYFPFIRLAFARYQSASISGCHLSPVVTAGFAQIAPERTATVSGTGTSRTVTVTGRSYTATAAASGPSVLQVQVERATPGVSDPDLRWQPVSDPPRTLTSSVGGGNLVTWTGTVTLPADTPAESLRLTLRELETHPTGLTVPNPIAPGRGTDIMSKRTVYLATLPV